MTNRTIQFWGQGYSTPDGASEVSLTPCAITASFNGTQVFSGTVPTIDSTDVSRQPGDQSLLFSFEIDPAIGTGVYPVVLNISGADIYLEQVLINYCAIYNPVYSQSEIATLETIGGPVANKLAIWEAHAVPPLSTADIALLSTTDEPGYPARNACLAEHGIALLVSTGSTGYLETSSSECRSDVVCTGASYVSPPPPDTREPGLEGTWGWEVEVAPGETATFSHGLTITQQFLE